jgi:putative aldouronate transport system substrate-binding protein
MKKIATLLMVLIMAISLLAGCSTEEVSDSPMPSSDPTPNEEQNNEPGDPTDTEELGLPLVDEKTTFTGWITSSAIATQIHRDINDNPTFQELENRTNIHIDWSYPAQGGETEALNLMLTSNDFTDFIITMAPTDFTGGFDKLIDDQVIINLKDMVEKYSPNYLQSLKRDETVYKQVLTDTGALPAYRMLLTKPQLCYLGYYVRTDLLEQVGYTKEPVTYDDWHEMLLALKGTTNKQPLYLFESVLIPGYGVASDFIQIDGKVVYGPMTDEYRQYIEMASTWYKDGLIDSDFMTRVHFYLDFGEYLSGNFALYPMVSAFYDMFTNNGLQIKALPYAKLNEADKRYINSGSAESTLQGSTGVITTDCDDITLLMRWFDYLYSDEGSMLASFGIEDLTYTMVDGGPVYTDLIMKNEDSLAPGDAKTAYTFPMLMTFLVQTEREYVTLSADAYHATEIWDTDWDRSNSRTLYGDLTTEESIEYSAKFNDINTYVSEFKAQVISGNKELNDTTWNEYVNQIKSMGIERCIELKQAALDRFFSR